MSLITDDDDEVAGQANAAIASAVRCVTRDDGRKCHVFLNGDNRCQCRDVDLNAYREAVLG